MVAWLSWCRCWAASVSWLRHGCMAVYRRPKSPSMIEVVFEIGFEFVYSVSPCDVHGHIRRHKFGCCGWSCFRLECLQLRYCLSFVVGHLGFELSPSPHSWQLSFVRLDGGSALGALRAPMGGNYDLVPLAHSCESVLLAAVVQFAIWLVMWGSRKGVSSCNGSLLDDCCSAQGLFRRQSTTSSGLLGVRRRSWCGRGLCHRSSFPCDLCELDACFLWHDQMFSCVMSPFFCDAVFVLLMYIMFIRLNANNCVV